MDQDIKSQLDRAKTLFKRLKQSVQADLTEQEISTTTRNLTQEVLLKMNRLFDQSWRVFFTKHYGPKLSKEKRGIAVMSESALHKDWLDPEEDKAWRDL